MADPSDLNQGKDNKRSSSSERAISGGRRESRSRRLKSADLHRSLGSSSSSTSMNTYAHDKRLEEQHTRQIAFKTKTAQLAEFLQSHQPTMVSSESAMATQHHFKLATTEEYFTYSIVSQSNLPGISQLNKATFASSQENARLFGRVIKLNKLTGEAAFRLSKNLAISKYVGDNSSAFLKIHGIFCVNYKQIFVFHERFKLEDSLWHKAFSEEVNVELLKQWTCQLAAAVEHLSLHGVAHRFVRVENVLLPSTSTVKLASFDMACFFWDPDQRCLVPSPKKALPIEGLASHLLNHLPPEAFADNYDCSMVDVWGIGVLLCTILAGENPFTVTTTPEHVKITTGTSVEQWKSFQMKQLIPCEIRSLLNDIFVDADARMTAFDLVKDKRLSLEMNSDAFLVSKPSTYYRVDLAKNINLDMPALQSSIDKPKSRVIQPDLFSAKTNAVFDYANIEKVANEEAIAKYKILRDDSFTSDLSSKWTQDRYLKASKRHEDCSVESPVEVLVKIVQASTVQARHYHQIRGESSKIMRYFSCVAPIQRYIHQVHDIYRDESRIYIFSDVLTGHRSLQTVVQDEMPQDQLPPLSCPAGEAKQLSQENVFKWTHQLAQTVAFLGRYGISHRYVRPEFIFIAPHGNIKLSHFDLACFGWHPTKHVIVARSRGLQDELERQWNHLPPECFQPNYESLLVDVWSTAVVFVFSLTGVWPFLLPNSADSAADQWTQWKLSVKGRQLVLCFKSQVAALDQVFVPFNQRITAESLVRVFSGHPLDDVANTKQRTSTGITRVNGNALGLEPKERKSTDNRVSKDRKASAKTTRGSSTSITKAARPSSGHGDLKEPKEKKSKNK